MGGRILHSDSAKYDEIIDEIQRLADIDSQSYKMMTQQRQALGRIRRGGSKNAHVVMLAGTSGRGKSVVQHELRRQKLKEQKLASSNDDNQFPQWDFIGELIIDTRNVDFEEENYGVVIVSSSVIPLTGSVRNELLYQESLNRANPISILGLEQLDECEVDVGVFRYVFGIVHSTGIDILMNVKDCSTSSEHRDNNSYELISRQKYDYTDEEYVTHEVDLDELDTQTKASI